MRYYLPVVILEFPRWGTRRDKTNWAAYHVSTGTW